MNKLTIQINNLEALERLIGGDSEVEVDIRNSVVQKFAEKHLKSLANSDAITNVLSSLKSEISDQVRRKCEAEVATFKMTYGGSVTDIKFNPAITAEIDRQVRNFSEDKLVALVKSSVDKWSIDYGVDDRVEKMFEYYSADLIKTKVKAQLEKVKASL